MRASTARRSRRPRGRTPRTSNVTRPTAGACAPAGGTRSAHGLRPGVSSPCSKSARLIRRPALGCRCPTWRHIVFQVAQQYPDGARALVPGALRRGGLGVHGSRHRRTAARRHALGLQLEARRRRRSVARRHRLQLRRRSGRGQPRTSTAWTFCSDTAARRRRQPLSTSPARAARALPGPAAAAGKSSERYCRVPESRTDSGTLARSALCPWHLGPCSTLALLLLDGQHLLPRLFRPTENRHRLRPCPARTHRAFAARSAHALDQAAGRHARDRPWQGIAGARGR